MAGFNPATQHGERLLAEKNLARLAVTDAPNILRACAPNLLQQDNCSPLFARGSPPPLTRKMLWPERGASSRLQILAISRAYRNSVQHQFF
jgi:hypothetical protein